MKKWILLFFLLLFTLMFTLSSCSQKNQPYFRVYRHNGVENYGYLKPMWGRDRTCSAYDSNCPIQRSTWAKQHYYNIKKR
jgi:hypothetical protein